MQHPEHCSYEDVKIEGYTVSICNADGEWKELPTETGDGYEAIERIVAEAYSMGYGDCLAIEEEKDLDPILTSDDMTKLQVMIATLKRLDNPEAAKDLQQIMENLETADQRKQRLGEPDENKV